MTQATTFQIKFPAADIQQAIETIQEEKIKDPVEKIVKFAVKMSIFLPNEKEDVLGLDSNWSDTGVNFSDSFGIRDPDLKNKIPKVCTERLFSIYTKNFKVVERSLQNPSSIITLTVTIKVSDQRFDEPFPYELTLPIHRGQFIVDLNL